MFTGNIRNALQAAAGAVAGAALGWILFAWMLGQGFYALALPGALLGIGCSLASGRRSTIYAIACGVAGVALAVVLEGRYFPMIADEGFAYFLRHLHELSGVTYAMIALSGIFGFWFGLGRATTPTSQSGRAA